MPTASRSGLRFLPRSEAGSDRASTLLEQNEGPTTHQDEEDKTDPGDNKEQKTDTEQSHPSDAHNETNVINEKHGRSSPNEFNSC